MTTEEKIKLSEKHKLKVLMWKEGQPVFTGNIDNYKKFQE